MKKRGEKRQHNPENFAWEGIKRDPYYQKHTGKDQTRPRSFRWNCQRNNPDIGDPGGGGRIKPSSSWNYAVENPFNEGEGLEKLAVKIKVKSSRMKKAFTNSETDCTGRGSFRAPRKDGMSTKKGK